MPPAVRARSLPTLALGAALLLVACGGQDDEAATATPSVEDEPAETAAATPETTAFGVGEELYYGGFAVTIDGGTLEVAVDETTEEPTYTVTLDATLTNLGDDQAAIQTETALVQDGTSYGGGTTRTVDVAGGLTGEDQLTFEVDEAFDPDRASLVIGTADEARASVPLGPDADEAVPREPEPVDVDVALSLDLIDVQVSGGELRYDDVARHEQVEAGSRALVLPFTATSRKGGNWSITASDFALTGPDGVSVPVDNSRLASLTGADVGATTEDLFVQFLVDEQPAGEYTLVFAPADYWIEGGPEQATATFTLP